MAGNKILLMENTGGKTGGGFKFGRHPANHGRFFEARILESSLAESGVVEKALWRLLLKK